MGSEGRTTRSEERDEGVVVRGRWMECRKLKHIQDRDNDNAAGGSVKGEGVGDQDDVQGHPRPRRHPRPHPHPHPLHTPHRLTVVTDMRKVASLVEMVMSLSALMIFETFDTGSWVLPVTGRGGVRLGLGLALPFCCCCCFFGAMVWDVGTVDACCCKSPNEGGG